MVFSGVKLRQLATSASCIISEYFVAGNVWAKGLAESMVSKRGISSMQSLEFKIRKLRELWRNRPKARLMRECLELAEQIKQSIHILETKLKK